MKKLVLLCSTAFAAMPATALAQSTGTQDFETIVVTGTRTREVGGIQVPDSPKPKAVLTQEIISRSNPGQTILDTINLVPGVSFQNNDAYGSSGGTLNIRGFDSSRISLTFDGLPLNDSGNYAIYSNQQLDPELIEQVNVSLGSTDVDSPTASAVGGTVNYRTLIPPVTMGGRAALSIGEYDFRRAFGMFSTGSLFNLGTRAFISASTAKNDNPFNNYGKVDKQQYNARVYHPLGENGDFISVAGHYNQNRNNFFGSLPLRTDAGRTVGSGTANRFPINNDEREYEIDADCSLDVAQAGVADVANSCGTVFDRRYNPSNTGNVRFASRFTLTPNITLTVDPSFQYVKANGGGTVTAREFGYDLNPASGRANCSTTANGAAVSCATGFFGGSPYAGVDLNGDGDLLDTVSVLAPSQTRTRRVGVISGLRWDVNPDNVVRFSYTYDRANHRQTGQVGLLEADGEPEDVFPVNDAIEAASGLALQKRDRQSFATLHQVSGEYRGEFGPLTVNAGVRAPFFKRDLENNCFTATASGFVECSGGDDAIDAQIAALNPAYSAPGRRVLKYDKLLPNVGAIYDFTNQLSGFLSYAKGLSVPGTDNLYNAFFFAEGTDEARPDPETTDTYDTGLRFRSGKVQAQFAGWFTKFDNRLASAYDPELNATVYRNLGRVDKYGIDGSVAYQPIRELTLYGFGSWNRSKIKDNVQLGSFGGVTDCDSVADQETVTAIRSCAFTRGNREAGTPKYTYGASVLGEIGDIQLGVTAKRTGSRFVFDNNQPVYAGDINGANEVQVYNAKADAYWLVNLDARYSLRSLGLSQTYLQANVYNLFDEFYVGGFGGGLSQSLSTRRASNVTIPTFGNAPFVQIGAPRTMSLTLNVGF